MRNELLNDEEVKESIEHRPPIAGPIPSPLKNHEYLLTDKRVIKRTNGMFNEGTKDLPLGEIVSVNYSKNSNKVLIAAASLVLLSQLYSILLMLFFRDIGSASEFSSEVVALAIPSIGLSGLSFILLLFYTYKTRDYIPVAVVVGFQFIIFGTISYLIGLASQSASTVLGTIVGIIVPISIIAYAVYGVKGYFIVQSSNPEASIELPGSRDDSEVQKFSQTIRQEVDNNISNQQAQD